MAIELQQLPNGVLTALGAIAQFRFVKNTATAFNVDQCGAGDDPIGISQAAAGAGDGVQFNRGGVSKLVLGGTVAAGDALMPDSTGRGILRTGSLPAGAIALEAGAVGNTVSVLVGASGAPGNGIAGVAQGYRIARGQKTTVAAADTVVTGLTTVVSVVATLESDLVDDPFSVTAQVGDQAGAPAAGSIVLKTWKNTGGTDPTPAAATTFGKLVNWIAIGT